jgi:hypothetical protein
MEWNERNMSICLTARATISGRQKCGSHLFMIHELDRTLQKGQISKHSPIHPSLQARKLLAEKRKALLGLHPLPRCKVRGLPENGEDTLKGHNISLAT